MTVVDPAEAALVALRALHFLACMLLFGEALFVQAIDPRARLRVGWMLAAAALALASALGWLALAAVAMSGEAPAQALRPHVLGVVVAGTEFGRVWALRVGELLLVAVAVPFVVHAATPRARRVAGMLLLLLAAHHLVTLAWMGHAAAAIGRRRVVDLGVDAVHLLAAGAWLGSLPALVAALRAARSAHAAVAVTRRYSQAGLVCVVALVATGVVNAGLRNVGPASLVATDYGRLLLAKLAVFAAMLALAAANRFGLTRRLVLDDATALVALRRNAALEVAGGIAVVALVAVLGITPPPDARMDAMQPGMHMH